MSTKWIFIQPQDVWMFRDAKPFTAGQSFIARSVFPPYPPTLQGAIRTQVIEESSVDWAKFGSRQDESLIQKIGAPGTRNGHPATLGNFAIRGPFVGKRGKKNEVKLLVPLPLDLQVSTGDEPTITLYRPDSQPSFETYPPFVGWHPLTPGEKANISLTENDYDEDEWWLDIENFETYLQGKLPTQVIRSEEVYRYEARIGLAMEHGRRTAKDEHLYHAEFVRPSENIGLLAEIGSDLLPDRGFIGLGGEARAAYYEKVQFQQPKSTIKPGRLKVILLTPAYFSNGWQPTYQDWSVWVGPNAQLVSIALGRPTLISGWDVARNQPKPLHHFVPSGSIYYFENATPPSQPFTEDIPDESFEGGILAAARLGFGSFAVGIW